MSLTEHGTFLLKRHDSVRVIKRSRFYLSNCCRARTENIMTAACCLNLSKHSIIHTAAAVWVSVMRSGVKKKKGSDVTCRWGVRITHHRGVIFGLAWTTAPIGLVVVCTHAKERDAVKSLLRPHIFIAKRDAISSLGSKFLITFFFWTTI